MQDFVAIFRVAGPAMTTNLATPIGGSYVTKSIAEFSDNAVAGAAIIGRLVPVPFCGLIALSGAVGPIIGQNMGGKGLSRGTTSYSGCRKVCWLLRTGRVGHSDNVAKHHYYRL